MINELGHRMYYSLKSALTYALRKFVLSSRYDYVYMSSRHPLYSRLYVGDYVQRVDYSGEPTPGGVGVITDVVLGSRYPYRLTDSRGRSLVCDRLAIQLITEEEAVMRLLANE